MALRDDLATWQVQRGIRQWLPGEMALERARVEAQAGQWFVLRTDDAIVATARVLAADPAAWGAAGEDGTAGYLHGLMVRRDHAGRGLGAAVVSWFEEFTRDHGRRVARLDCVATNPRLRAYYTALGYREVGIGDFGGDPQYRPVRLFTKDLVPEPGVGSLD